MDVETEGDDTSALKALSRNWRSSLVVNGLHDALKQAERERDEMA
ncbi:unnamed protein product, partial [Choristocarpus tenellus]